MHKFSIKRLTSLLCVTASAVIVTSTSVSAANHTGSAGATHMQLKKNGSVVCSKYNTSASSRPIATGCPDGTFTEQLFNSSWSQIGGNKTVTVGGGGSSTGGTHTGSAVATHMQIKNGSGSIVCKVHNTAASSRPVARNCPSGTYTEQLFNSSWSQIGPNRTVTISGPSGGTSYSQIFREDFNGNSISSKFKLANWSIPNRDTTNNINSCSQSGGKLNLSIKNVGNQRQTCYLISKKNNFGPGDSSTLKVEYRANVSQVKARGAWFAGWLFPLGGNAATDSNKNTGVEYDVFEYMPTWNVAYNTAIHDGDINLQKWIEPKKDYGIDLRQNKYHTFAVEWNKNCMAFFIDGRRVNTNTSHVSKAKRHTIMLTMEGQSGTQWDTWNVGSLQNNINNYPATGRIDWVRVSEKASIDPNLCF